MTRLRVTYHLDVRHDEAEARADAVAVEQTVEVPRAALTSGFFDEHVIGQVDLPLTPRPLVERKKGIKITYRFDANNIIQVHAEDLNDGHEADLEITHENLAKQATP